MLPRVLSDLASVVGGTAKGNPVISGLAIDSRKVTEGDLFVALKAERDGHDFIDNAAESGASAARLSGRCTHRALRVPKKNRLFMRPVGL